MKMKLGLSYSIFEIIMFKKKNLKSVNFWPKYVPVRARATYDRVRHISAKNSPIDFKFSDMLEIPILGIL